MKKVTCGKFPATSFSQNHQYFSKDGGGKYYSGGEVSAAYLLLYILEVSCV